ncbi:MAG: hypothetical protein QW328_07765 [Nitrososphaerota archaeon]
MSRSILSAIREHIEELESKIQERGMRPEDVKDLSSHINLSLLGLALLSLRRIDHLSSILSKAEERLFDEQTLSSLRPRNLMELYRLVLDHAQKQQDFFSRISKELNWESLMSDSLQEQAGSDNLSLEEDQIRYLLKLLEKKDLLKLLEKKDEDESQMD